MSEASIASPAAAATVETIYTTHPWLAHYEPGVPTTVDLPDAALTSMLADSARRNPHKTAVRMILRYTRFGAIQSRMSFRELDRASDRFAAALRDLHVRPGDRVSLMLPNLPQGIVAYFGVLKAGAVVVNTNPTYTPRELRHQLHDSGAHTVITLSGLYDRIAQVRADTAIRNVIVTDVSDTLVWPLRKLVERQLRRKGTLKDVPRASSIYRYRDLMRSSGSPPRVDVEPDDVALFQYSGGTTGLAKAAMLTHRNLAANVAQINAWFHQAQPGREKILGAIPFFHVYGMTVAMLYSLLGDSELIVVPDPRDTDHILEIIQRERVTIYPGVPAMYVALINHPRVQEYDLRSIKACLSGGAALPVEVAQRFEQITGGRLVEGFGMTECSPAGLANPLFGTRKIGAIGLPLPSTEAMLVELEPTADGRYLPVAAGQAGELIIRGPQVMKGYWNQPDETASIIDSEGWLHTGDIATMDEQGYFSIVDRKKDLIIASGYNIVPREVEEVLFMHPAVREAAVIGVPDAKRGETVKAFVVLREGQQASAEQLIAFCKENLAPYKVPKAVAFRDELPKSMVGKVLRRVLMEEEKQRRSA